MGNAQSTKSQIKKFKQPANDQNVILPSEILTGVFSFLGKKELGRVARVCQLWNSVSEHNGIWKEKFGKTKIEYKESLVKKKIPHQSTDPVKLIVLGKPRDNSIKSQVLNLKSKDIFSLKTTIGIDVDQLRLGDINFDIQDTSEKIKILFEKDIKVAKVILVCAANDNEIEEYKNKLANLISDLKPTVIFVVDNNEKFTKFTKDDIVIVFDKFLSKESFYEQVKTIFLQEHYILDNLNSNSNTPRPK